MTAEPTAMDRIAARRPRVRLLRSSDPAEALAFVTLPGQDEVRVRFRRSTGPIQWRCDVCGDHRFSTCDHERAAARAIREKRNDR